MVQAWQDPALIIRLLQYPWGCLFIFVRSLLGGFHERVVKFLFLLFSSLNLGLFVFFYAIDLPMQPFDLRLMITLPHVNFMNFASNILNELFQLFEILHLNAFQCRDFRLHLLNLLLVHIWDFTTVMWFFGFFVDHLGGAIDESHALPGKFISCWIWGYSKFWLLFNF